MPNNFIYIECTKIIKTIIFVIILKIKIPIYPYSKLRNFYVTKSTFCEKNLWVYNKYENFCLFLFHFYLEFLITFFKLNEFLKNIVKIL